MYWKLNILFIITYGIGSLCAYHCNVIYYPFVISYCICSFLFVYSGTCIFKVIERTGWNMLLFRASKLTYGKKYYVVMCIYSTYPLLFLLCCCYGVYTNLLH